MVLQRVDGEVNLKVELQPHCLGVRVLDFSRHVFFPQLKEHLAVPVVEAPQQVSLFNTNQGALVTEEASEM